MANADPHRERATGPGSSARPWAESLDALIAAPGHHSVLLENDRVRVLDTRIAPGETVPVHTHRWPSVLYVLQWAHCVRRDTGGSVLMDTRIGGSIPQAGAVLWSPPLPPHTLENVGESQIHVIAVELKGETA